MDEREGFIRISPYSFSAYHPIGDADCAECCHDAPASQCEKDGCSGIIHSEVEDEMRNGDGDYIWIHTYRCDRCGSTD